MKGIVFTEFMEYMEAAHDYEMVDDVISAIDSPSNGSYTAVGSYPFSEMVQIITEYSKLSKKGLNDILREFGHHLFGVFQKNYGHFFDNCTNAFDFLESVDSYIHVEVTKLYPDAELPKFEILSKSPEKLEMRYRSERSMSHMAKGLIEKTLDHYGEEGVIEMENVHEDGSEVRISILKK